ncbi:MAG: phosphatase PAP2 family protein, partial [Anaerolineaceae bacterium]|nr:phosphatase PAP2 family protein [Anaerolineaceae bacterium]
GTMLLMGNGLNGFLKILLHTPRPFWFSSQVKALSVETSFGAPSGHAQNAAGIWGLLAALLRRGWLWSILLILILLIGVSRIYLGMHFTSDVIAGWFIGFLLVLVFIKLDRPVSTWLKRSSAGWLAFLAVMSSFALIGLHYLALATVGGWQIPAEWVLNATSAFPLLQEGPFSAAGQVTVAGVWLGMSLGALWLWRNGGFGASGSAWQRLARYLLGGAGILIFYVGLGKIFPRGEDLVGLSLRYLRYTLVGLWVAGGAPWVFFRLGWAKRKEEKRVVGRDVESVVERM